VKPPKRFPPVSRMSVSGSRQVILYKGNVMLHDPSILYRIMQLGITEKNDIIQEER
jgi:hypothetical protein